MAPVFDSPDFVFKEPRIRSTDDGYNSEPPIMVGESAITVGRTVVCSEGHDFYDRIRSQIKREVESEARNNRLHRNRNFAAGLVVLAIIALLASLRFKLPSEPALAVLFSVAGIFVVLQMKIADLDNDARRRE